MSAPAHALHRHHHGTTASEGFRSELLQCAEKSEEDAGLSFRHCGIDDAPRRSAACLRRLRARRRGVARATVVAAASPAGATNAADWSQPRGASTSRPLGAMQPGVRRALRHGWLSSAAVCLAPRRSDALLLTRCVTLPERGPALRRCWLGMLLRRSSSAISDGMLSDRWATAESIPGCSSESFDVTAVPPGPSAPGGSVPGDQPVEGRARRE